MNDMAPGLASHQADDCARAIERVRAEYLETPGLTLTVAQASRLWSCEAGFCMAVRIAGTYLRLAIALDHKGDAAAYEADEQVQAGYAMAEFFVGNRFMLLPVVRYERTRVDYLGYDVLYDDGGNYASTRPVSVSDASGFFLPGLHARYALTEATNLRADFTRTLARPNYYDLVPYQLVFQEDAEIARGNSTLKPTVSNTVDVLLERYFESVGVLSGGVFYKRLTDYIFPFRFQEANFGDLYEVTQPRNGDAASLWGMELAFQNRFAFLPAPLDGLGLYGNYTWTDSSARFPDRDEDSTLPGQSAHVGNVALWYEKAGFSARSAWNFHGRYVDAVGDSALRDVYYDDHVQWDLSFSQQILRQLRAFVDVLNLTIAALLRGNDHSADPGRVLPLVGDLWREDELLIKS